MKTQNLNCGNCINHLKEEKIRKYGHPCNLRNLGDYCSQFEWKDG